MKTPSIDQIRIAISIAAIAIAIIHISFPTLGIDTTALMLIGIAIFPWIFPILKSIEFPGGLKIEMADLQKLGNDAKESGLLERKKKPSKKAYPFELVTQVDPNLALAGLLIEIEKVLHKIAEKNSIKNSASSVLLIRHMVRDDILSVEEGVVLSDLLTLLSQAVHGALVDPEASAWAITTGILILEALEARLS